MKRIITLMSTIAFSSGVLLAQNFQFSGGYSISALVCSDGQVYSWGSNIGDVKNIGILGTSSTKKKELTPSKVVFPQGVKIKQVDAGSGTNFLAVDSDNYLWAWGDNAVGQTGQGSIVPNVTSTPKKVLTGQISSGDNFLPKVSYISAGNSASFAILENKTVVSWGNNMYGQLGNNSTKNNYSPVYVLDSLKKPLENVIQVDAGDFSSYALVDDDNDGVGTVYSWGAGKSQWGATCMLGRNAKGNRNNGLERENDSIAKPVILKNNLKLDNIVSISAGDVFCLALDKDGFVWAWGNNNWGGLCGINSYGDFSDPRKVVGGATKLPFLKAKKISSGQGFGMAITIDNKPVAWGNNSIFCTENCFGGLLGIGKSPTQSFVPVYVRFGADTNSVHNNVESISDGDMCGFYTTTDKKLFVWGGNTFGQLGLGDTLNRYYAVPFNLDILSCKLEQTVITGNEISIEDIKESLIFPTPASNFIDVHLTTDGSVKILSLQGSLIENHKIDKSKRLNIENLQKGTYIFEISQNQTVQRHKIIVQ